MRILGEIRTGKFLYQVFEDSDKRVYFTADASIDADGANGQNGKPAAYKADDSGTDYLINGAMKIAHGKVVCANDSARDIVILDADGEPKIFPGNIIASMTLYRHLGKPINDPSSYVDSEVIPYIVVPDFVFKKTTGVVCGCKARASWKGKSIDCVVADKSIGRIGELSIAAARAIDIPSSPRDGGYENPEILYELWPGIAAPGFVLQPA